MSYRERKVSQKVIWDDNSIIVTDKIGQICPVGTSTGT